jgi:SAGA-associated factor 11
MLLYDLLRPLAHEATAAAYEKEKRVRRLYGASFVAQPPAVASNAPTPSGRGSKPASVEEVTGRPAYVKVPGRDIYGNQKETDTRYFECSNCGRKIAGTRFAAHIERCLSGRKARNPGATTDYSTYNSPSVSPTPSEKSGRASPVKRKLGEMLSDSSAGSVSIRGQGSKLVISRKSALGR